MTWQISQQMTVATSTRQCLKGYFQKFKVTGQARIAACTPDRISNDRILRVGHTVRCRVPTSDRNLWIHLAQSQQADDQDPVGFVQWGSLRSAALASRAVAALRQVALRNPQLQQAEVLDIQPLLRRVLSRKRQGRCRSLGRVGNGTPPSNEVS